MKCFVIYEARRTLLDFHSHSHYEMFIIIFYFLELKKNKGEKNDIFVSSKVINGGLWLFFSFFP
jgi:hypothetical protein